MYSVNVMIIYFIHRCNGWKETSQNKTFFYLPSFLAVLTVLTVIIELCWYPGCLFAVPTDNVEVRKQVQGNLHKELKAKQGQNTEVDVGQLGRKRLVVQIPCRLRHFFLRVTVEFGLLWRQDWMPLQITDEWSCFSLGELARPDKVQLREKMLCSCQSFSAASAMLHTCACHKLNFTFSDIALYFLKYAHPVQIPWEGSLAQVVTWNLWMSLNSQMYDALAEE